MSENIVALPLYYYGAPNKKGPLFNAKIYVGIPDLDPHILANRYDIIFRNEDGTDVPISPAQQPVRTSSGGYATYNGQVGQILVDGNYSIAVDSAQDAQQYYWPNYFSGQPLVDGSDHNLLGGRSAIAAHDQIYRRETTVAEIESGVFVPVGSEVIYLSLTDRDGAMFDLSVGGVPDGLKSIDAGGGNTAVYSGPSEVNVQHVGADLTGSTDAGPAIVAALSISGYAYLTDGVLDVSTNVILEDNQTLTRRGDAIINLSAIIGPGLHTKSGGYIAPSATSVYYKDEPHVSAGWSRQKITSNAGIGSTSLALDDISDLNVGDYVSITNGYCDMWRVLETSGEEFQKVISPDVDLWKNSIHQIKSKGGSIITLNEALGFDCPVIPKTYGFFPDENDLSGYAGFNYPTVEKLVGAVGVEISNLKIINNTARSIIGYACIDTTISGCDITHESNVNKPIELYTSVDAKISNNRVRALGFSYSIRRSSKGCIMNNNTSEYGGNGDGPALFWERAYSCQSQGFTCSTYGGPHSSTKIGFYMNTCHSNVVSGVNATGFGRAVHIGFGGEGCVASDVTGFGCDVAFGAFAARDFVCSSGSVDGSLTASGNPFADSVITASSCYNGSFSDITQSPLADTAVYSGRVHISQSIGLTFDNVKAPNAWFHASTEDDLTSLVGIPRATTNGCEFHSFDIASPNFDQAYTRPAILNKTKLNNESQITKTHYTEFNDCNLLESLVLVSAPFTKLRRTKISSAASGVNFGSSASDTGRFRSSMIDLGDCQIDAPNNFNYYENPQGAITGGSLPTYTLGGGEISLLDQYPLTRVYKNPGQAGTVSGWLIVSESPSYT